MMIKFFSRFGAQFFEWRFFLNYCRILSDYTSLNICYAHFNKTSRRSMVISLFMVGPLDSSSPQAGQVHDSGHRNWNMESSRGTAHKLQGPWRQDFPGTQEPKVSRDVFGTFQELTRLHDNHDKIYENHGNHHNHHSPFHQDKLERGSFFPLIFGPRNRVALSSIKGGDFGHNSPCHLAFQ